MGNILGKDRYALTREELERWEVVERQSAALAGGKLSCFRSSHAMP